MTLYSIIISTPKGDCTLLATDKGICFCSMPGHPTDIAKTWAQKVFGRDEILDGFNFPILKIAKQELEDYNDSKVIQFTGPFDFHGAPFQNKVWDALTKIPYGKTKTYGQIASELGNPHSARAVGTACRANPIAILVPCHRVIGNTGRLTGYAGGIETKQWLLELEKSSSQQLLPI